MPNPRGSVRGALRAWRTRTRPDAPSLWRRAAAVLTTLALAGGLAVVGMAAPASAHTGDLKGTAVCNTTTGKYDVTYTLTLSQVGNDLTGTTNWRVGTTTFEKTPTSAAGMDRTPVTSSGNTTLTLGTDSIPGNTKGAGPWVYAYTKWSDGFGKGSDGNVQGLKGDCVSTSAKSTVSGEAKCVGDGLYSIVWTVKTTGAKAGDEADVKVIKPTQVWLREWTEHYANHHLPPLRPGDVIVWEQNVVGKKGDSAEVTFQIDWKQSGSSDPEGKVTLPKCDDAGSDKITYCHATSSTSNPYNQVTTSVSVFRTSGHIDHEGDIYPAFTYTWYGALDFLKLFPQTATVPARGDTSLLQYPDCVKPPTVVSLPTKPAVQDKCGVGQDRVLEPAAVEGIVWEISSVVNGKATAIAKTKPGFTFPGGVTQSAPFEFEFTDVPCPIVIDIPAKPAFDDKCGVGQDRVLEPTAVTGIVWEISPVSAGKATAIAKTTGVYTFPGGATQSAPFEFEFTDVPCPIVIDIPAKPAFDDKCGVGQDRVLEPTAVTGIVWEISSVSAGKATAIAKTTGVYTFPGGATQSAPFEFEFTDVACPPTIVTLTGVPTATDDCGPDNGKVTLPEVAAGAHYRFVTDGSVAEGRITVTVIADDGYTFDKGQQTSWPFDFVNTPCLEIKVEPTSTDLCGLRLDGIALPEGVEHVTWSIDGDVKSGAATAIATADAGYTFAGRKATKEFPFTFTNVDCIQPTLEGSTAAGECDADVPWITYAVKLTDPDNQATSDLVTLTLSDGTNSEVLELGELDDDGTLSGRILWPGAAVDDEGNAVGWPGWEQLADGTWQETEGNFAWTRAITTAVIHVNPDLSVDLSYPPSTPDCVSGPTIVTDGGGEGDVTATAGGGTGLASTGFAGTGIAIVAGIIVLAGAAFLVIARVRRKRA